VTQCNAEKIFNKLFGKKDVEEALQRVNQLTRDEEKLTTAHILKVVDGLDKKMRAPYGEQI